MSISAILIGVISLHYFIAAMIITKYRINPTAVTSNLTPCGINASAFHYCAARVTNDTCEPLARDWCDLKDMSTDGSYLIKRTIIERFENTSMALYTRWVPIYLTEGSELEFKFMLYSGWNGYRINLYGDPNQIVLHASLQPNNDMYCLWKPLGGSRQDKEFCNNTINLTVNTEYTLIILCDTNSFQIYLNGEHVCTYEYRLLPTNVSTVDTKFNGVNGELYQVAYRSGL